MLASYSVLNSSFKGVNLFYYLNREGSVIVSLVLSFKTPITTNEGLVELTAALIIGTIGPFSVCCLKITRLIRLLLPILYHLRFYILHPCLYQQVSYEQVQSTQGGYR